MPLKMTGRRPREATTNSCRALTLDAAFSALHSVCHKWFRIGLLLGVPTFRLEIIMTDRLSTEERMLTMLEYWMSNVTDPLPSWEVLVNALKAPTVGESGLAWALEERYCSPADQSSLALSFPPHRFSAAAAELQTAHPRIATQLKLDDLGVLKQLIQPVAAHWVALANQLGMTSLVPTIWSTPDNTGPPAFLGDLLYTWLMKGHPTLEALCQALREDDEIIGGAGMAQKLEERFRGQRGKSLTRHLFNEAMKHGYVLSRNTTVLFLGAAGSGKTCSKHVLMNERPPKSRKSTPIAERPVKVYKMLTDKDFMWHKLSPEKQKEILTGVIRRQDKLKMAERPISTTQSSTSKCPKPKSSLPKPESSLPKSENSLSKPERCLKMPASDHVVTPSTIEEEFVTLLDELPLPDTIAEPLKVDVVYITDSGGQPQFHEVLPLFLGHTSVCIFVMKLSECLDAQPLVEYYDNDNLISKPQLAGQTNQQILKHCVRTMRSHRSKGKPPKIVFIGTFKDLEHKCSETRATKNEKLLKMLLPHFKDEVIYSNLPTNELIFALNTQDPGKDEWELAEGIREVIMTKCSPELNEIPLQWYALELALQALGKEVMSKAECFAEACKLHFDTESFEAALQYLHKLNIIFYYPKTLPNVIFTNHQVLLNKVTELVKESYKLRNKESKVKPCSGESQRFRDHALVTLEFLNSFDTHYIYESNLFTPHDLVKLFRELLIFADSTNTDEYFVPCLLQILSNQEVANCKSSAATVPLILHFPDGGGGPHLGIFCSLTVFLLSAANQFPSPWKLAVDSLGTPVCLYRNCIKFMVEGYPCMITLIDTFSFFEVHVACSDDICPQLYFVVRKALLAGVREAASTLGYNDSYPNLAFLCSCPRGDLHLAVAEGSYWICTMDPERQTCFTLGNKHKMWLTTSEPLTVGGKTPISTTQASSADADKELTKKPSLAQLMKMRTAEGQKVEIIKSVAPQWQQLGALLDFDTEGRTLDLIEEQHKLNGPVDCCQAIMKHWLKGNGKDATWAVLIEILDDIEQSELARQVKSVLQL